MDDEVTSEWRYRTLFEVNMLNRSKQVLANIFFNPICSIFFHQVFATRTHNIFTVSTDENRAKMNYSLHSLHNLACEDITTGHSCSFPHVSVTICKVESHSSCNPSTISRASRYTLSPLQ